MRAVNDKHGVPQTDSSHNTETVRTFHKNLYAQDNIDPDAQNKLFCKLKIKLTDAQKKTCEGEVTKEELRAALTLMDNNKSPGKAISLSNFTKKFRI